MKVKICSTPIAIVVILETCFNKRLIINVFNREFATEYSFPKIFSAIWRKIRHQKDHFSEQKIWSLILLGYKDNSS
jgi:hypothetical protein